MKEKELIRSVIAEQMPDMEDLRKKISSKPKVRYKVGLPVYRFAGAFALVLFVVIIGNYLLQQNGSNPQQENLAKSYLQSDLKGETKDMRVEELPEMAKVESVAPKKMMVELEEVKESAKEEAPAKPESATPKESEKPMVPRKMAEAGDVIIINAMKNSEAKFDAESKDMTEAEIEEIRDLFLSKVRVPQGLLPTYYSKVYTREEGKKEYTILHDYIVGYHEEGTQRSVSIGMSKDFKPLRDYFADPKDGLSTIRQTEVRIYEQGGENGLYMAFFTYKGMNFDVETAGISEEEMLVLIRSIVQ